jgi:hypothetical protein
MEKFSLKFLQRLREMTQTNCKSKEIKDLKKYIRDQQHPQRQQKCLLAALENQ